MAETKPCLKPADARAYQRVASLPDGAAVDVRGTKAQFIGMTGYLVTLRFKGRRGTVYLRAGDPRIREIADYIGATQERP